MDECLGMGRSAVGKEHKPDVPVIDYEGSDYRQAFWEGQGREYEDAVERSALQQLLPPTGGRIAEIGAGFGRLADLYKGYDQIILFDYSRTLLADAVNHWSHDARFVFVAGNIYDLPLASGVLDTLVMPRVMHHLADVPAALVQLERSLHQSSCAVLEYANKRNLKAIGRWLLGRQKWSPFAPEPVEFVRLNFDFHPVWMDEQMAKAGLVQEQKLAISHFRLPLLKRFVPVSLLVKAERPFFTLAGKVPLSPSVFTKVRIQGGRQSRVAQCDLATVELLFRCPQCGSEEMKREEEARVSCPGCNRHYARKNGIWDFKEPI
jgi:ubiquinone/menaquinone biosynthesis C-methylase UbiE